jgi:glycine betaine/proline transport system permease protein
MSANFPELLDVRAIRVAIDSAFTQFVIDWGESLELFFLPVFQLLMAIEDFLLWLPWYVVLGAIIAAAYFSTQRVVIALSVGGMLFVTGAFDLWEAAMKTLALMLTATLVTVALGIPLGILMARSKRFQSAMLPVLDIMQTLPIFVYLIPFVMLFGPGKIPALLATIVFALPPVIRLTDLGIRQVDPEVVEAYRAFGATQRQLLTEVQIPLALPTILAGINQTTMMALSMVVIASMIGADGLGYQVLQGIQRLEVSRGLLAGLSIVFVAVMFDRIVQAYGRRIQQHLHIKS